jgi:preprotein translocase subunit SecA
VLNHHRLVIYGRRNRILEQETVHDEVEKAFLELSRRFVEESKNDAGEIDTAVLMDRVKDFAEYPVLKDEDLTDLAEEPLALAVQKAFLRALEPKMASYPDDFARYEKALMLQSIDELWMRHIDEMAHLREEVAFEGFAQKQPLVVYKERAYEKFVTLVDEIGYKACKGLLTASVTQPVENVEIDESKLQVALDGLAQGNAEGLMNLLSDEAIMQAALPGKANDEGVRVIRMEGASSASNPAPAGSVPKVGRNDPCPCGSGKKYKHCHGK